MDEGDEGSPPRSSSNLKICYTFFPDGVIVEEFSLANLRIFLSFAIPAQLSECVVQTSTGSEGSEQEEEEGGVSDEGVLPEEPIYDEPAEVRE